MDDNREPEIARGLRRGKIEAWQALYDAYCRRVWYAVARLMGPESADVADVVQETFLAAAAAAPQYDSSRGSLWRWLYGIARNHVALYWRNRRRQERWRDAADPRAARRQQVVHWLAGGRTEWERDQAFQAEARRRLLGEPPGGSRSPTGQSTLDR